MISNPKFCPECGTQLAMRAVGDRTRPVCPACGFIFYLNPIVAAGSLVEHEGCVALVRRGVEPGRGMWGLPAGYVEADESAEQAAVRETWEEAHLQIEPDGLLDAFSYGQAHDRGVLLIYAAHVVGGEIEAGDDAIDARWFEPDNLPEIAFRTHREVLHKWRQARAVVYRPATIGEAEVVRMLAEVYPSEGASLPGDSGWELYVAVDNGQVVGYATVSMPAGSATADMGQVFVHPRYRRWGIGTQLIRTCVRQMGDRGVREVQVRVPVSDSAWTVYLKAGFQVCGFSSRTYLPGSDLPQPTLVLTCSVE